MKKYITVFNFKVTSSIILLLALVAVGTIAPRQVSNTKALDCASLEQISSVATFNPFQVGQNSDGSFSTENGSNCLDQPTLSVKPQGSSLYYSGANPNVGDILTVSAYIHNGARQDIGTEDQAYNVTATFTVDTNPGSSHSIQVALNGSRGDGSAMPTKTGYITINTPANATLQVNSGSGVIRDHLSNYISGASVSGNSFTVSLGNQMACFEYAKFVNFTVTVVGGQEQQQVSGTINANTTSQVSGQCLWNGHVDWSTAGNPDDVVVAVTTNGSAEYVYASWTSGSQDDINWFTPGYNYHFILYANYHGSKQVLATKDVTPGNLNCGTAPTVKDFNLSITPSPVCVGNQSDVVISNASSALNNEEIFWSSTKNGQSSGETMSGYSQFVSNGGWSGKTYAWTNGNIGSWTKTATIGGVSKTISFEVKDCSTPSAQSFNLSITPSPVCVGTQSNVSITNATSGLNGKQVFWTSTKNNQATGENLSGYNQFVSGGSYSGKTSTWNSSEIGSWTKTASFVDQSGNVIASQSASFQVKDCTQAPSNLTCSASVTSANVGDVVTFTATGGSGSYTWATSNNSNAGYGSSFNVSFASAGNKTVTVTSGSQTASCGVNISQPGQQTYTATATAAASASASASCSDGTSASATASASASASATSNVSQADAQSQAQSQAQSKADAQAHANASASASAKCSSGPIVCISNTNYALNAGTPVKTGSTYSVNLTWSSTGSHQIKITQVVGSGENTIVTGNASGNFTVSGLAAGGTYLFKLYDVTCNSFLTSVQVTTPGNPGQLTCSANVSSANVNDTVIFTAQGGNSPYTWATSNNSNAGSGSVFNVSFLSAGNKTVSVTSGDGQTANCGVVINAPQSNPNSGNCNNSSSSCNNNTNTNTSTNGSGNNNSNQNNNSNVNGNNNTVTQTNNNCVNNSCNNTFSYNYPATPTYPNYPNYVYINSTGYTVPANQFSQLSLTKQVSSNSGSWQNSVSVSSGQVVQFLITVTNSGNASANNVRLTDQLPSGLTLVSGSVSVNGSMVSDSNLTNGMYVGNLSVGQSQRVQFSATVNSNGSGSIQNNASATSDNAGSASASAWVFTSGVLGGSVSLNYQKRAFNDTKNVDATSVVAAREDYITYTLTATNNGNTPASNFIITDDLSQVLPYADVSDNGGGSVSGNTITFPGITVPAGGSVTRNFRVRVKYSLSDTQTYVMTNTYGNSVVIRINSAKVLGAFVAPKTGADTNAFVFSGLLCAAFAVFKKRQVIMGLVLR